MYDAIPESIQNFVFLKNSTRQIGIHLLSGDHKFLNQIIRQISGLQ